MISNHLRIGNWCWQTQRCLDVLCLLPVGGVRICATCWRRREFGPAVKRGVARESVCTFCVVTGARGDRPPGHGSARQDPFPVSAESAASQTY